jgi:hypothetical protein
VQTEALTMGSIYKRGTRSNPKFYLYNREGSKPDGRPRYVMAAAKGTRTP